MADSGKQQITNYYGKDLRSIFANQENYGLFKPGVYKCEITPVDAGSASIQFKISKGSTFIFQDTAKDQPTDDTNVSFLTKIVLEADALTTPISLNALGVNTLIQIRWKYSEILSDRYASFELASFGNDLKLDSNNKRQILPIAVFRDYNPSGTGFSGCTSTAYLSYLEAEDTLDIMEDIFAKKSLIKSIILKNNVIAISSASFFANQVLSKTSWYKYTALTDGTIPAITSDPDKSVLFTENFAYGTAVVYVDPDSKSLAPKSGGSFYDNPNGMLSPGVPTISYLHKFNYGYTWIAIPDIRVASGGSVATRSQIDVVILIPTSTDDIDTTSTSSISFSSRPKLRVFSTVITDDLSLSTQTLAQTTAGTRWTKSAREEEMKAKIINRKLNMPSGAIVGFFIRGFSKTDINAENFLRWSGYKENMSNTQFNRLQLPSLNY
jgi:hypothetical protein